MYNSFYLIGIGFLFLSANWMVGLVYLGSLTLMVAAWVGAEEKMMTDHFGDEYRLYMEKTGCLLPRIMR
jgi:protein-S-isoprenylcysteine O-methyltransferase Ste14